MVYITLWKLLVFPYKCPYSQHLLFTQPKTSIILSLLLQVWLFYVPHRNHFMHHLSSCYWLITQLVSSILILFMNDERQHSIVLASVNDGIQITDRYTGSTSLPLMWVLSLLFFLLICLFSFYKIMTPKIPYIM